MAHGKRTIVATGSMSYGMLSLKEGVPFEATNKDADILVRFGKAREQDSATKSPKGQYRTRQMTAQRPPATSTTEQQPVAPAAPAAPAAQDQAEGASTSVSAMTSTAGTEQ